MFLNNFRFKAPLSVLLEELKNNKAIGFKFLDN